MSGAVSQTASADAAGRVLAVPSDLQRDWWGRERQFRNPDLVLSRNLDVTGTLDRAAFERAVRVVVGRHEALRTSFAEVDGELRQVVEDPANGPTAWFADLTDLPEERARARAEELIEGLRYNDFILDQPPLVVIGAIRLSDTAYIVSVVVHHIIMDGWAMGVLMRELSETYAEICAGGEPADRPPAPRLRDWTEREQEWNAGPEAERELAHWRSVLGDTRPVHVPFDIPPTSPLRYRSTTHLFTLGAEQHAALQVAARKFRATASVVCMAAFFELLSSRIGRPDVAAVTIFNRRGSSDVADLIGCVMNAATISVRTGTEDGPKDLVRQTRDAILAAHGNQRLFVSRVWDAVHLEPGSVDALFIYDVPAAQPDSFGPHPASLHVYDKPRQYERTGPWWENFKMRVVDSGGGLTVMIEYNSLLYRAETIGAMAEEYRQILARYAPPSA